MLDTSGKLLVHTDFANSGWLSAVDRWWMSFYGDPQSQSTLPLLGAAAVTATMGFGLWMASRNGQGPTVPPLVDPQMQTKELPDGSRVSKYVKDGQLLNRMYDDARTVYESVQRGARVSNNGPMLGHRVKMVDGSQPYVWMHYKEVLDRALDLAKGFRAIGLPAGTDTFIGIYAKNRPEWIISEMATYTHSNVIVPLYETLGAEACAFIVGQTEMRIIVCDVNDKATKLLECKDKCPSLAFLVTMEQPTADLIAAGNNKDVRVMAFSELEALGHAVGVDEYPPSPPTPADLATICYTSGTTGTPKGVMLTHGNVVADCSTLLYFKTAGPKAEDVMISFLPLAHMFERILECAMYVVGGRVGYFRGDIKLLTDDIKELRPTFVPVVPRVLNRIYDKVMQEVNKSRVKRAMFDWAMQAKKAELDRGIIRSNSIWDKLVFKKVREGLGGRVRLIITGSAPLSENVLTFIRAAMGCVVCEGYGQTECVAAATVTMEGDHAPGQVGMPVPCCAIKLVDVPELGYLAKDQAGEVCIRGNNVFQEYYKNPEQTAETLDEDGWLHTGDIGRWTSSGTLKIVDRKKHIFKLAQGEYIAPEKIENVYVRSKFVAQNFVHGESLKSCLIAVVVPDAEVLPKAAEQQLHLKGMSVAELCRNDQVKKMILDDMTKLGKDAGLHSFEQVKDIYLAPDMFTVENQLLTPTLKSKRPELKRRFSDQLAAMYSKLD